jgi:predicted DNA-binding transcriptional regulator AlpA
MKVCQRSTEQAHARLVLQLCEAISGFVAATTCEPRTSRAPEAGNDNAVQTGGEENSPPSFGLRDILSEYGLSQPQVAKLRARWGFPAPLAGSRPMRFPRDAVEAWARQQPNRSNLAIVLRSRKRRCR